MWKNVAFFNFYFGILGDNPADWEETPQAVECPELG